MTGRAERAAAVGVMVVFGAIAAYDAWVGATLLLSTHPEAAHGDTLWLALDPAGSSAADRAAESLFRRLGALQLTAAGFTVAALVTGWRRPEVLDAFLLAAAVVGGAIAWTDAAFFAGTRYHLAKQLVGAAATLAMSGWLAARLRGRLVSAPGGTTGVPGGDVERDDAEARVSEAETELASTSPFRPRESSNG